MSGSGLCLVWVMSGSGLCLGLGYVPVWVMSSLGYVWSGLCLVWVVSVWVMSGLGYVSLGCVCVPGGGGQPKPNPYCKILNLLY